MLVGIYTKIHSPLPNETQETITDEVPYFEYWNDMGIYRAMDQKKTPNRYSTANSYCFIIT